MKSSGSTPEADKNPSTAATDAPKPVRALMPCLKPSSKCILDAQLAH